MLATSLITVLLGGGIALGMVPGPGSGGRTNADAFAASVTPRATWDPFVREAPTHVVIVSGSDTIFTPGPPPPPLPGPPPPPSATGLIWPVHGRVAQEFGHNGHPGIDIDAPYGAPIAAAGSGVVAWAGWQGGYGNLVVIDHGNGVSTAYGHQSRIAVARGQSVTQGQVIGYEGSTGYATGPHVHFEVRVHNTPRNPRLFISGNP